MTTSTPEVGPAREQPAPGRLPSSWRDVTEGLAGAAIMAAALLTPFLRARRNRWGVGAATAARAFPGDGIVPRPRWQWTHGVEIDAPAGAVWPWVSQIGADRAGFYSYQWLENLVGCGVRNADEVRPEWEVQPGDGLRLHPDMPPLEVVHVEPGRCFVAHAAPDPALDGDAPGRVEVTWTFLVEPLGERRCRVISRYRCATASDRKTRALYGPALVEPIGFAMDRRMLLGIKARAER